MGVSPAVRALCENSNEVFLDVAKLLLTYADNILRYPNEDKYRSIRIGNPTFFNKLLPIKGAVDCLFEMGFEEAETHLVFPKSASVEQLKLIRESIAAERDQRLCREQPLQPTPQVSAAPTSAPQSSAAASSQPIFPSTAQIPSLESSMSFLVTLQSNFQHMMLYENPELQQKARSHIPHQKLSSAAQDKLKEAKDTDPAIVKVQLRMLALSVLALMTFAGELSVWRTTTVRAASSLQDSQGTIILKSFWKPEEGAVGSGQTVSPCVAEPWVLRLGTSGTAQVYHVWTEIYSVSQRRWLHCDSCENTCDKPLLYEVGWGKKLAYILAFSKDQVVDVTWRYSCKHPEVLQRRTKVQEAWLLHTINRLNSTRQQSLSPERKKELTERLLVELVEFISPKTPKPGELGGRSSGSLAWRIARGECRPSDPRTQAAGYVFTPTQKEKSDRLLHVRYSSTKDQYCRLSNNAEIISSWDQCVWSKESVFRKVENDWQMVYVARTEGSCVGTISWKFDVAPVGMKIESVSVMASSQTFHTGKVSWHLKSAQITTDFSGDGKIQSFSSLSGSTDFIVEAELSGGEGETSWQHSQLFRQSLKETEDSSFEILIYLQDV
ncbi:peptide-N(4)-(N-acetyl-beta-glucosaminyl)asparagine amidase isoform X2 [Channa argus]|uniref:peptide-N(4)-(N-acetyl-beta- glucosaminyl)asparagine amidase isoform X2 n=1 Tax=Channa argus TaxID=215402 RepID=UPI003522D003